jgi:pyruvate/2-oxoglutarate dehydrogenase complex dihydrolipoamide dehydrogenase (E3) component
MTLGDQVSPVGSFTEPEYAQVGLTEAKARETHDVVAAVVRSTRPRARSSTVRRPDFASCSSTARRE